MPEHELAADAFTVGREAYVASWNAQGPPFRVQMRLNRGQNWPQVALELVLDGERIIQLVTTEPRLHEFASWLAIETA